MSRGMLSAQDSCGFEVCLGDLERASLSRAVSQVRTVDCLAVSMAVSGCGLTRVLLSSAVVRPCVCTGHGRLSLAYDVWHVDTSALSVISSCVEWRWRPWARHLVGRLDFVGASFKDPKFEARSSKHKVRAGDFCTC